MEKQSGQSVHDPLHQDHLLSVGGVVLVLSIKLIPLIQESGYGAFCTCPPLIVIQPVPLVELYVRIFKVEWHHNNRFDCFGVGNYYSGH